MPQKQLLWVKFRVLLEPIKALILLSEQYVCEKPGIEPAPISHRPWQRDRQVSLCRHLLLLLVSIDKFANRN